jgi:hypothetical protein
MGCRLSDEQTASAGGLRQRMHLILYTRVEPSVAAGRQILLEIIEHE